MPKFIWDSDTVARFWEKVEGRGFTKRKVKAHWIWTGATNEKGYGIFRQPWGVMRAHRMAYILHHDLPRTAIDGVDIHHAAEGCPTACVNPFHLEAKDSAGHDIHHNRLRSRSQREAGTKHRRS
jgi:hypothetical protein